MKKRLIFNKIYFFISILLFLIEVFIAIYVKDRIIRPYVGDILVVILVYTFIKSFLKLPVFLTALFTLFFAFWVEILQYFDFVNIIGLEEYKIARIVLGTSFAWEDFLAYFIGFLAIMFSEKLIYKWIK